MPRRQKTLALHEEVLLLALRNDKGTVAGGVMFQQAAGGAILAELVLQGRLGVSKERWGTYAVVLDRTPTGDGVVDECLRRVADAGRRRKLENWVHTFSGLRDLKHRVAAGLVRRGVLRAEERQLLMLFTRRAYPEVDASWERRIVERLEHAIGGDIDVDARTAVLVALAEPSGLLKANLDRRWLRGRRARVKAISNGDAVGKATRQAIEAVHAAIIVATIMPATMAATTH